MRQSPSWRKWEAAAQDSSHVSALTNRRGHWCWLGALFPQELSGALSGFGGSSSPNSAPCSRQQHSTCLLSSVTALSVAAWGAPWQLADGRLGDNICCYLLEGWGWEGHELAVRWDKVIITVVVVEEVRESGMWWGLNVAGVLWHRADVPEQGMAVGKKPQKDKVGETDLMHVDILLWHRKCLRLELWFFWGLSEFCRRKSWCLVGWGQLDWVSCIPKSCWSSPAGLSGFGPSLHTGKGLVLQLWV